jgi:hypothetical protein
MMKAKHDGIATTFGLGLAIGASSPYADLGSFLESEAQKAI